MRKAGFRGRIIGVSSPRTTEEALRLGVIDEALPIEEAAPRSDLIYLAQPISRILRILETLDEHLKPGSLVTDAGSTKRAIAAAARARIRRAEFLGGHPMAGKESRGVGAGEAELFAGRPYVLTPKDGKLSELGESFRDWVVRIGARPLTMTPARHDRLVALVSHLPQLSSTALAATLDADADREWFPQVAGPGLLDNTRLALSAYEIWSDIIATNGDEIERALDIYIRRLAALRESLSGGGLEREFSAGERMAAELRHRGAHGE